MWSFIKSLFSSDDTIKTTNKVIDNVSSGIDKLILTDEERLDYNKDAMNLWLKMQKALGDENSVRAKARRALAVTTAVVFFTTFLVALVHICIGYWIGIDTSPLVNKIIELAKAFSLGTLSTTVFVFYFGKGILDKLGADK